MGTLALKRGFPKTFAFAQARAVFAVASNRCEQVFDPPGGVTLWKLPAEIEDQFNSQLGEWTEQFREWEEFFEKIRRIQGTDLLAALLELGVIGNEDADQARKLKRAADNRAVPISGTR